MLKNVPFCPLFSLFKDYNRKELQKLENANTLHIKGTSDFVVICKFYK